MAHVQRRCDCDAPAEACRCKRERVRYRARYSAPNGAERSRTFQRRSDAERWLASVEVSKARGEWIDPSAGQRTFGEYAEEWFASTLDLRTRTRELYEQRLRTHVVPRFGSYPLASIAPPMVREWVAELTAAGLSPDSVAGIYQLLHRVMESAESDRLIGRSPCVGIRLPSRTAEEMRFLTPDELELLAANIHPRFRALVLTAGYVGPRWGELAGLKRPRLNLLHGTLDIAEVLVESKGRFSYGPPKTNRGRRTIMLPPFLVAELEDHLGTHARGDDLVFTGRDGMPLRRSNFSRRFWRPAVEAGGLAPLRFHDLRHTATSYLIAIGCHPAEIATRMGWASISSMLARYGHLLPSLDGRVRQGLEDLRRSRNGTEASNSGGPLPL